MDILSIDDISKTYAGTRALDHVTLSIPEGGVYGLLGPNGAGKTTLIRIINHITVPDAGRIFFQGHPLTSGDIATIGYLPEERGLYRKMRVGDQALFFAKLKGLKTKEATDRLTGWFDRLGIMDWWNKKVEELSKGMAQKLQFIVTVLHQPRLLIFDEPFSGLDPINTETMKREILRLRDEGATIVFSTHNMDSVERLCDNITLLNHGHNILSGNVEEIRQRLGAGRMHLRFTGSPQSLLEALDSRLLAKDIRPTDRTGEFAADVQLRPDVSRREAIAVANEAVELLAFDRALPSMNDIFISAVNLNNQSAETDKNNANASES